jgi:KUP system potassium uptake protein
MDKDQKKSSKRLFILSLTAIGVVFGDIGTSPLYAVRECFYGDFGVEPTPLNIMGALSMIFWALILVISLKYLILILRADNDGEGGILALMELVIPRKKGTKRAVILAMGLFGAALLYGDGMITPAISVLSAVEGLKIATPFFEPYIVIITIIILLGLFMFQKRGTRGVGIIFGPLILVWFFTIASLGVASIMKTPEILKAVNPYYAFEFFALQHWHGIFILGAVFLVVTGGEALYADIGHFGKRPIRIAWFGVVLPCLLMNYFGQGALLLRSPEHVQNPFYLLAPSWGTYPLVIIATIATIIASQAVITGAYSLTFQALQLGFFPRLTVTHTSEKEEGQIYMPYVNWILFVGTISLVLLFKTSGKLAAAYGVAVTTTMVITTMLAFVAMTKLWKWKLSVAIPVALFLLCIDLSFFFANIDKIPDGGWFPLLIAGSIYLIMTTWYKGRRILNIQLTKIMEPLERFINDLGKKDITKIPGTAIYFTRTQERTPPALIQNLKHNKMLHEQVIILSINFQSAPRVEKQKRLELSHLENGFYTAQINYGFMDRTNIPQALELIEKQGINIKNSELTYFLGRETLIVRGKMGMPIWRETIFAILSRNAQRATRYFNLPAEQVFEVGTNIEI